MVGANLAGLSFGQDGLGDAGLTGGADALLGDTDNVVMTEDSVDEPPRALQQTAPVYPERARKKGVTGRVVLSLLIDAGGSVQDVRVTESQPAGVFDEAAVSAVQTWRFQPAMYEGRPVSIRVTLPLRFGFDG
jgi:protein TonB